MDDDPALLRLVAGFGATAGFEIVGTSEPLTALELIIKHNYRMVICDVDMPGLNGLDLLKQIKQHDGGILVTMLTGVVTMNTVLESLRLGAEACFFKPIESPKPLIQQLKRSHEKIQLWWATLRELQGRKKAVPELAKS